MATGNGNMEKAKKIRINFANVEELKTLPSVGDATAQNMVYFRAVNGNITAENLVTIKFVKESKELLDRIDFEPNTDLVKTEDDVDKQHKIVSTSTEQTDQTKQLIGNIEELLNAKNGIENEKLGVNKEYQPVDGMNSETLDLEQAQLIHSHLDKFQGAISNNKGKPVSSQPTTGHLVTDLSSPPFSTQMSPGQPMYSQSMFTNSMQGQPMLGQPMQNQYSVKNMQGHVHMQNLPIQSTGQSTFVQKSRCCYAKSVYSNRCNSTSFSARYVPTQSYVP